MKRISGIITWTLLTIAKLPTLHLAPILKANTSSQYLHTGVGLFLRYNLPIRSLAVKGPGWASKSVAAGTVSHTFHNRTPRTRLSSR